MIARRLSSTPLRSGTTRRFSITSTWLPLMLSAAPRSAAAITKAKAVDVRTAGHLAAIHAELFRRNEVILACKHAAQQRLAADIGGVARCRNR